MDLTSQEGPPSLADVATGFNNVVESPDEWHQEGNLLIRVHNRLRVGKFMPDASDPFLAGKQLEDWRLTRIRNSDFQHVDKPWSLERDKQCTPLRA